MKSLIKLAIILATVFSITIALADSITLYSGRSQALVEPLIKQFERDTGVKIKVRYGTTAQLALALQEEGDKTPADIFWAQDAGALSAVSNANLFTPLPTELTRNTASLFQQSNQLWVTTSGRARVLAYSTSRIEEKQLPKTIHELTDPKWQGKIGWAPTNASFQAFVTAMRKIEGEEKTANWLTAMKNNGTKKYHNNPALVEAIAAGEIDLAITNHYYLLRFLAKDPKYPVGQAHFNAGDPGNLLNVSGAGILKTSNNKNQAQQFLAYLLNEKQQHYFMSDIKEYPIITSLQTTQFSELLTLSPKIDSHALEDLKGTLSLLRHIKIL